MSNIIYFDSNDQFQQYLKEKDIHSNFLGYGGEGSCYQSSVDSYAYKILHNIDYDVWEDELEYQEYTMNTNYSPSSIITTQDIELESFLFPIMLFAHQDYLLGYTTKCISKNLFDRKNLKNQLTLAEIDFDKVLKAYEGIIPDIEKLSNEQIRIFDLPHNLIFDNEKFYGIDTCGYKRVNVEVLNTNLESLNQAIISIFEIWTKQYRNYTQFKDTTIEEYLKEIKEEHVGKAKSITY